MMIRLSQHGTHGIASGCERVWADGFHSLEIDGCGPDCRLAGASIDVHPSLGARHPTKDGVRIRSGRVFQAMATTECEKRKAEDPRCAGGMKKK